MESAIDLTELFCFSRPGVRDESIEDVCLRVTIFAIGVVKNLERAPARNPTLSSSMTGKYLLETLDELRRDWRMKL